MAVILDAQNKVMGRLASVAAKRALEGEEVIIVNAAKAVVTGSREAILERWGEKFRRGDRFRGPFLQKQPDRLFRRVVRGMLPWKTERGRQAFKRVKVFSSFPEQFAGKAENIGKSAEELRTKFIRLEEISKSVGAKL